MQRRNSSNSGMGVGRVFSRGGPKVVKFGFYPSKLKKKPFLLIISKSRGALPPAPPPLPTPMFKHLV